MGEAGEVLQQEDEEDDELEQIFSVLEDEVEKGGKNLPSSSRLAAAEVSSSNPYATALPSTSMLERAKYIPLRLSYEDRKVISPLQLHVFIHADYYYFKREKNRLVSKNYSLYFFTLFFYCVYEIII